MRLLLFLIFLSPVVVFGQLQGGTLSPSSQTLNYDQTPAPLILSGATPAGGSVTYTWESSLDNTNWGSMTWASGTSYQSPSGMAGRNYYRVAVSNGTTTVNSNSVSIYCYPYIAPGSMSPANVTIYYGQTPPGLSCGPATGGNNYFSYQWDIYADHRSHRNHVQSAGALCYYVLRSVVQQQRRYKGNDSSGGQSLSAAFDGNRRSRFTNDPLQYYTWGLVGDGNLRRRW